MAGHGKGIYDPAGTGGYNPESAVRGMVGADSPSESDSDGAGRYGKHQGFSVQLHLADGVHAVLYHAFLQTLWMDGDGTVIEVPFNGMFRAGGELKDGDWKAIIRGKRLEGVFEHLSEGRRLSVKVTLKGATGPVVSEISVKEL